MKINHRTYRKKRPLLLVVGYACACFLLLPIFAHGERVWNKAGTVTIAHVFLDIEKPFGSAHRHYVYVERLVGLAKKRITVKSDYTTEEAVKRLNSIQAILKEDGLVFKKNFLLSTGIDNKAMDCDNFCSLFVAISEQVGLPVIPVYAPNHCFLRFCFKDGSYLNWEPLEAKNLPDDYYIKNMNIADQSIRQGVYLASLTRKEFIGVEYNNIGAYLFSKKKYADAIKYLTKAIELYPKLSSAYHNRGTALYAIKQTDRAFEDLKKANSLDPNQSSTHNTLGDIYFDRELYDKAVTEYKESIRLNPSNHAPYYSIGLILERMGNRDEAEKWIRRSRELKGKK